jgi:hypothetical protein
MSEKVPNSVITNSAGPAIFVRYNRVSLCSQLTNLPQKSVRYNRMVVNIRVRYNRVSLLFQHFVVSQCHIKARPFRVAAQGPHLKRGLQANLAPSSVLTSDNFLSTEFFAIRQRGQEMELRRMRQQVSAEGVCTRARSFQAHGNGERTR